MEQVHNKAPELFIHTLLKRVSTQNTEIHRGTEFMYIHTTELSLEIAPKFIFSEEKKQADSPRLLRRLLEANIQRHEQIRLKGVSLAALKLQKPDSNLPRQ